jgi:hypothetical protein
MRNVVVCTALLLVAAVPANAQSDNPRFIVSVNAGVHTAAKALSDHFEFEQNVETATVDISYPFEPAALFDGGIAVRLWKQLGVGVAVSSYTREGSAAVDASIPHPFFFNQPRTVTGDVNDVSRTETGVHVQIVYVFPTRGRFRGLISAGPSRIEAEQEVVTAIQYDESFPFDEATFRSATTRSVKGSKMGFNVGADVSFLITRVFGVGAMARFTRADMDVDLGTPANRRIAFEAGGFQAGGGIRIVF